MSAQSLSGAPSQIPPAVEIDREAQFVSIRDLKVHFDLGVRRELDPDRRAAWIVVSIIAAFIGRFIILRLAVLLEVYPVVLWARIVFSIVAFGIAFLVSTGFALPILPKRIPPPFNPVNRLY